MQNEKVLVLARKEIFELNERKIFALDNQDLFWKRVSVNGIFLQRDLAEVDENFKQIIPYLVYRCGSKYFLMQRSLKAGEQRLAGKFTLGIGGHIRQEDLKEGASVLDWAKREFFEEINFQGNYKATFLGLLNDDSSPVGRVHLGCLFLLEGDSEQICVKEELADGFLIERQDLCKYKDRMEVWSQILLESDLLP